MWLKNKNKLENRICIKQILERSNTDQRIAVEFLSIIVYSFFLYFKTSIIDSFLYFSIDELADIEMKEFRKPVEEEEA